MSPEKNKSFNQIDLNKSFNELIEEFKRLNAHRVMLMENFDNHILESRITSCLVCLGNPEELRCPEGTRVSKSYMDEWDPRTLYFFGAGNNPAQTGKYIQIFTIVEMDEIIAAANKELRELEEMKELFAESDEKNFDEEDSYF